ncbi:MAG: ATP-binding protein [Christensenellaceae bacterium]|jgi:predicted AAA+ superfamily ATPase|nr:ATP-binding protein [Christensenellaceae bacterium]
MIKRQSYLNLLFTFVDIKRIKVLSGVRRSGKTILLKQIQQHLIDNGKDENQIIYINFESIIYKRFLEVNALYEHIVNTYKNLNNKIYLFLDGIQNVLNWNEMLISLLDDIDCDIYIVVTNSSSVSNEISTLTPEKYIRIQVYPFTLSEAKAITIKNGKFISNERLFNDYLLLGGLPMRFSNDGLPSDMWLTDTFKSILQMDVVERTKVVDFALLDNLLNFLMNNIGHAFSINSIARTFNIFGYEVNVETIMSTMDFIERSMALIPVRQYNLNTKCFRNTEIKFYSVDLGFCNIIRTSSGIDYNKLSENVVFLELLSRGYEVFFIKTVDCEVDFVAFKNHKCIYVQVCSSLHSPDTITREFGSLYKINDNFPKYVVSNETHDYSRNGIMHYNIINFLLDKSI